MPEKKAAAETTDREVPSREAKRLNREIAETRAKLGSVEIPVHHQTDPGRQIEPQTAAMRPLGKGHLDETALRTGADRKTPTPVVILPRGNLTLAAKTRHAQSRLLATTDDLRPLGTLRIRSFRHLQFSIQGVIRTMRMEGNSRKRGGKKMGPIFRLLPKNIFL
jgi:hypothetical protein